MNILRCHHDITLQAALYLEIGKWATFLSREPSSAITLLFIVSIFYYIYDIFAMRQQYRINNKSNKEMNELTSSNTYFIGFVIHHLLCIYGLIAPIYNKVQWKTLMLDLNQNEVENTKQCGLLILICFMLGELPNIPRLAHKIISRRFLNNTTSGNVHNNTLHSVYFVFKGCFIWCRLGLIQLTYNMLQPIAPFNVTLSAWLLNVFGVIAVIWEWRMMQFKNYQATNSQSNPYMSKQN